LFVEKGKSTQLGGKKYLGREVRKSKFQKCYIYKWRYRRNLERKRGSESINRKKRKI